VAPYYRAGVSGRDRVLACCRAMEVAGGPVAISELAKLVDCTPRQIQRDFQALGISPGTYGRAVRTDLARASLRRTPSIADALTDAGYGSVRSFYDEVGRRLGMTPSEYAAGAPGLPLLWATTPSAIGVIVAVASDRGLCAARIGINRAGLVEEIKREFSAADLREDEFAMVDVLSALRALAVGRQAPQLPLDVHGTAFQARVWQAIRTIPSGQTRTYTQIADQIKRPTSIRAVAAACAGNPVALAVPCHRVIRSDGSLAGYAWGIEVKEQLLTAEQTTRLQQ